MSGDDFKSIPTDLPPRFEIRRLEAKHLDWAVSIVIHSNLFHSPVWPNIYPKNKCKRAMDAFKSGEYLIKHQIDSGLSFGVFDLEYKFKREESKATDGKLYWDVENVSKDESGAELLEQMDFPLCSVAMAYDGFNPLDMPSMKPLIGTLPAFLDLYEALHHGDKRDPASWQPTAARQVLMRNATSSRHDIEGKGIMKKLAYFLMRYAHSLGFRGIQIECLHDKVTWVWTNPPPPFVGTTVAQFNTDEYKKEEDGTTINPFEGSKQTATKVYVDLRPGETTGAGAKSVDEVSVGALG